MAVSTNLLPANTSSMETDVSGWTAFTNTTTSWSTRWYVGAHSLQMKATAAGTATATTAARIAVTPGQEYTAYAYFSGVDTLAGRTSQVRINWYTDVTGGTLISSALASGTIPTASTWGTPPPIVISTAPATARYATVVVSASGLAAGGAVVVDAVAFGPPVVSTGNLLPYNVSGVEVDAGGWQGYWNATAGRTTTTAYEGWWALSLTAVATDLARIGTVDAYPVAAGTEYQAYTWAYPPATGAALHVQLRWYDDAGTLLDTSTQTWSATVTAGAWTRCGVVGTAPAGATSARIMLEAVATAGQVWLLDQMMLRPSPILAGSLLGYNAQSMEISSDGWTAVSGCTKVRATSRFYEGVASLSVTTDGTGDAFVTLAQPVPVVARQPFQMIPYIYHSATTADSLVDMVFTWLDVDGGTLSSSVYHWNMSTAANWYLPRGSAVAPVGAVGLVAGLRFIAPDAGSVFFVDNVFVGPGGLAVIPTAIPGQFGVDIHMQGMTTGGYAYWSLNRMGDDGTLTPVRGYGGDLTQSAITGDDAVVQDYEAPLGVPFRYTLKLWTGSTYASTTSDVITLDEPDPTMVAISDPGLPARNTTAVVGTLPDWTRSARQGVNVVRGRANPVVISDVRTSRTGTLTLITETQDDLDGMWWLLETGNTLLIRWPRSWGEPDAYVQVGDVSATHIADYAEYRDRSWSVPLTQVDRPVGGQVGSATRTWASVSTGDPDWLGVLTSGATSWLDVYTGVDGG